MSEKPNWLIQDEQRTVQNKLKKSFKLDDKENNNVDKIDICPLCDTVFEARCKCMIGERFCTWTQMGSLQNTQRKKTRCGENEYSRRTSFKM